MLDSAHMSGVQLHRPESSSIVRFGAYEIDLQRGELRKSGLKIRLQEQPLQVLIILLNRAGEVVTREDLRQAVWPEDTFVDFDHALNTAVKKIRAALGDDADNPRFVETMPRRGYKFIAPVERTGQALPKQPVPILPTPERNPFRVFAIIGVITVVIVLLGVAWKLVPHRQVEQTSNPDFERLTFDPSELSDARFTPDGASVIYSAGDKWTLYTQRVGASVPQSLGIDHAVPLSISSNGEVALLVSLSGEADHAMEKGAGTLAQVSLGGGAPRELLPNVGAAEWSPDGQLAVVRQVNGRSRLEYPIGKVLYENTGWISSPRFSPRGDSIAFLDHPIYPDDRGNVVVVDLRGHSRILSGFWESERGLAWSPTGEELWFAATRSGVGRALYAVNMQGEERRVLSVAGGLSLQDISHDGRVLLTRNNERLGIEFVAPGLTQPRELSWLDWSIAVDISPDGKQILFGEEGENAGPSYQVGLRPVDGSAPVMLGEGIAQSLSPDGKWALSILPPPNDHIVLLPIGAGTSRTLDKGPIERYQFERAGWLPDSKQIVFAAREPGHTQRCYLQSIDGGTPRAFTPDGAWSCSASPDGHILAISEDGRALLYAPRETGAPQREIKLAQNEAPSGWTADGKSIYAFDAFAKPPAIVRIDLASGRRQFWKQLPTPSETQAKGEGLVITPDGESYAYTYSRHLSDLYLVQGLR